MASQGPNSPGTAANDVSVGTVACVNPDNAKVSDDSYATWTFLAGQVGNYLKVTNFGFTIPAGAGLGTNLIQGVLVEVEKKATGLAAATDFSVRLVKGGTIVGSNKANINGWPGSDTYISYGGNGDLWSTTLTVDDVNASDFGVVFSPQDADSFTGVCNVDHVRITIYYGPARRRMSLGI